MKNTFYRYRPITITKNSPITLRNGELNQSKGKTIIDELRNREIYFASIQENNDLIDGRVTIYFQGDEINWKCFLRNYCFSTLNLFHIVAITGDDNELNHKDFRNYISPYLTKECQNTPLYKNIFKEIFEKFLLDKSTQEILKAINSTDKLYLEDIENLFWYINKIFNFYMKSYFKKKDNHIIENLIFANDIDLINSVNFENIFKNNKKEFDSSFKIKKQLIKGNEIKVLLDQENIITQKNYKTNISQANLNFNKIYFKELLDLIFNEYYISCFSENPDIDLLWAHYADKHKGICLIFETNDDSIITFSNSNKLKLKKINYSLKNIEINFFEYLGKYPIPVLKDTWFFYDGAYSNNFNIYNDESNFRKIYWDLFTEKSILKTSHWEYEKEYRLLLSSAFGEISQSKRLWQYNQEHLIGIIFGENTDIKLKKEIIKTMSEILTPDQFNKFQWKECTYNLITKKLELDSLILPFKKTT